MPARRTKTPAPDAVSRSAKRTSPVPKLARARSNSDISRFIRSDEITPVEIVTKVFPNGLRVISEKVTGASSLSIGMWVNAGSRDESLNNAGIAHFIEHMVFKGTAGRSMREIMRSIESRGGYLNAFTTKEHTCYYTWTRTTHLEESVAILFELATQPLFAERDIDREKSVVIEEINGLEDEPDDLVFDLFEQEVFDRHPLARPVIGTEKSIAKFARKNLVDFHAKHYRSEEIIITASGSHEHEALFSSIEAKLGTMLSGRKRRATTAYKFPNRPQKESDIERAAGAQAHIVLGRRGPGIHSGAQFAISALITLLGVGMSSRLNLRLREDLGLAYDAAAFYTPFAETGVLGLYVATGIENHDRVVKEMRSIVRGLFTRPISRAELDRTKEQMIGQLVLPMESITNRMMRLGQNELYFGKQIRLEHDIAKIANLTLDEVRGAAVKLLEDESAMIRVSVVPKSEDGNSEDDEAD